MYYFYKVRMPTLGLMFAKGCRNPFKIPEQNSAIILKMILLKILNLKDKNILLDKLRASFSDFCSFIGNILSSF